MYTLQELRKKNIKDMLDELKKAREICLKSQLSLKMNQDKKSHVMQKNKKYIAQILFELRSRQIKERAEKSTGEPIEETTPA